AKSTSARRPNAPSDECSLSDEPGADPPATSLGGRRPGDLPGERPRPRDAAYKDQEGPVPCLLGISGWAGGARRVTRRSGAKRAPREDAAPRRLSRAAVHVR